MYLSLNEAAKVAKVAKSTIHEAIKSGRLSVAEKEGNRFKIDPAELFRVFPNEQKPETANNSEPLQIQLNALHEQQIAVLREMIDQLKRDKDELRADRDRWAAQAERLAISDQRAKQAPIAPPSLFERLFGSARSKPPQAA